MLEYLNREPEDQVINELKNNQGFRNTEQNAERNWNNVSALGKEFGNGEALQLFITNSLSLLDFSTVYISTKD